MKMKIFGELLLKEKAARCNERLHMILKYQGVYLDYNRYHNKNQGVIKNENNN